MYLDEGRNLTLEDINKMLKFFKGLKQLMIDTEIETIGVTPEFKDDLYMVRFNVCIEKIKWKWVIFETEIGTRTTIDVELIDKLIKEIEEFKNKKFRE